MEEQRIKIGISKKAMKNLNFTRLRENDKPVFPQGGPQKEALVDSSKWDLVDYPELLESEASTYTRRAYRDTANQLLDTIKNAFNLSNSGVMAILGMGIGLKRLKNHLALLETTKETREFGERRRRIRVLKRYELTEHIFDNHKEVRDTLLNALRAIIEMKEKDMRDTAKHFGIQIPLQSEYRVYGQNDPF